MENLKEKEGKCHLNVYYGYQWEGLGEITIRSSTEKKLWRWGKNGCLFYYYFRNLLEHYMPSCIYLIIAKLEIKLQDKEVIQADDLNEETLTPVLDSNLYRNQTE